MKKIWTSLKRQKNLWIFLGIILLFGIGIGVYLGIQNHSVFQNTLANYVLSIENLDFHFAIPHFIVLSILFILSFVLIGTPMAIGYLFYEGLTIGFCGTLFVSSFQLGGFFYIFFYFLLTKFLFLLFFLFFFSKLLKISRSIISMIIYKTDQKERLIHCVLSVFLLLFLCFIVDLLIDFLGCYVIQLFAFLLH